ncbi:MAG: sugar ABC transporter substrate-binding protein [Cellulomonas sp. 73-145]|uniref:ABC transporter substrate-binding protein n=1 Tax=Cellulomonas sp. 73-145 TaxID=1895739 RepID=UPI00092A2B90|nr:ABC transporter substrate-binding protein [Cellulomonas sp. 73-145]MBN9326435.1 carbohydrate ABC transporter substrate-binding protein [Cellulomonas sp.]OJV58563.1 MAG: sugar ABC transporter substrate-binding protein [Cellulomonas sp. 73-145]
MKRNARFAAVAAGVAALATVAGCSSGGSSGTSSSAGGGGSAAALTGDCAKYQDYAGHSGKTVTMFGSILSPESDSLNSSWADFSKCTGITIQYTGSNTFESDLPVKVNGGNAPNLAIIPQPGLLAQMVATGAVKDPPAGTVKNEDNWNAAWKGYGSVDGKFYAAPMSANMKSLVWYSPKYFKDNGFTVPTTWADMMSLSDQMAGKMTGAAKPWCGGIGSGTASGWPATDWLEEVVLGKYGGQVYDDWISHKVKFSDPQIQDAMKVITDWLQNPKWVNGGVGDVKTIATTTFQNAGLPILKNECGMLQQASFYEAQWPKGTKVGPDGDVFAFKLPAVDPSIKTPVEGGGEFVTAFSDDPAVQAVQNYLSSPQWAESRIKVAPGWVSANEKVDQSLYTDPIDQLSAKYLADPSATFRFDASDAMPAAVGAGAEWTGMVDWFGSGKSSADVAKAIDAAWPS